MKIAIVGTTGFVGKSITDELVHRNHDVLGISRTTKTSTTPNLTCINLDVTDIANFSKHLKGYDILISAFSSGWNNPNLHNDFIQGSLAIQAAASKAAVKRYIVIGGAGSLYVSEKVQMVDTSEFPAIYKPVAQAAREYLNLLQDVNELDWLYFCPALEMHPGITTGRTGKYRHGVIKPIFDSNGKSQISVEDLAVVIADEVENQKYSQTIFTAAY